MKPSNIKHLQLTDGGHSGGFVVYGVTEGKDQIFNNQINKTNRCPIPTEMELIVNKLKIHALRICDLFPRSADMIYDFDNDCAISDLDQVTAKSLQNKLDRCWIKGVKFHPTSFVISFQYQRFDGATYMKYSTETVSIDDDYDYYDKVISILTELTPIAFQWVTFQIVATEKRRLESSLAAKNHLHNIEEIRSILEAMDPAEREAMHREYMEKTGATIISAEDALPHQEEDSGDAIEFEEEKNSEKEEPVEQVVDEPAEDQQEEEEINDIVDDIVDNESKEDEEEVEEVEDQQMQSDDPKEIIVPKVPGLKKG